MPDGSAYLGGGIGLAPVPPPAPREPYPAPEIPGHFTDDYLGKKAVQDLVSFGRALGWTVQVTHAKGCLPHATTSRPGRQLHSLAVRMSRGMDCAVAVYREGSAWSWDSLYRWSVGKFPTPVPGITEFKEQLL